ncbi:hypothetical protein K1W54_24530 [Micromonospora sp. CPCC 205371]|nr:hypothetical protein [Micromonospora sp. CPCC 205371]
MSKKDQKATGQPLSRHGSRVQEVLSAKPTTTDKPEMVPPPTIRYSLVCLPEELPTAVLSTGRNLARHLNAPAKAFAALWAKPGLYMWQRRQLIGLGKDRRPAVCAGGPVKLLDLAAMRHAAHIGATMRHDLWHKATRGTQDALPWHVFHGRHLANPSGYALDKAEADFEGQRRVVAMRLHNTNWVGPDNELDPFELDFYQCGAAAYANYRALRAVCTDSVITENGQRIQPQSDFLAHRRSYLEKAVQYVENLDPRQRVLCVTHN